VNPAFLDANRSRPFRTIGVFSRSALCLPGIKKRTPVGFCGFVDWSEGVNRRFLAGGIGVVR
jgi:hypothetical protein